MLFVSTVSCRQSFLKYWIKYSQCCVGNLAAASRHCCVGVLLIFLYATKLRFDIWWNVKSIMGWSWIGQIPHKFPRFIKCNAVVVLKRFYWKYWCVPRKLRQYIKSELIYPYDALRENCPNTELFLVLIFLYSDLIRRFTE